MFFGLAFVWSWVWWLTAAATGRTLADPAGLLLYLVGVFGPLVGAVWLVHRRGRRYRRRFLRRLVDPRGIAARWWLALAAVAAGPAAVGAIGSTLAARPALVGGLGVGAALTMAGPALVASLAEEPGWRGAALDALQARARPVVAATGIGLLWSAWHLPLLFLGGTYFHGLGPGTARFWLTHLMLVLLGILLVWLVNGSGGSVLLAVLAHTGFNTAMGMVAGSTVRDAGAFLGLATAVCVVVVHTRGQLGCPPTARPRHFARGSAAAEVAP
jgi:membrane protease YdiL (CAAX protease family)